MSKITEYSEATRFDANDVLIKDGTNGTKKIKFANAAPDIVGAVSGINHRNVYRGKNLGTEITAAQKTAISGGTFDDLFIGDYWTINSHKYVIADMDYWLNKGDTSFTKHHLVMIPGSSMYSAKMNESNTTEGGYVGSAMYTDNLDAAKSQISTDFGNMLLTHREYLVNAVTNGRPSAGGWFDSNVELMNEIMAYGCPILTPGNDGSSIPTLYTTAKHQLALFQLSPKDLARETIWLRDVVSAAHFALVDANGGANASGASSSFGVRPVFPIGVA